jgi:hypothetical protein
MCAKAGSPLGILTKGGSAYVPVSESMPDTTQNVPKPLVGEHARATGNVFQRNDAPAIEISEIQEPPNDVSSQ